MRSSVLLLLALAVTAAPAAEAPEWLVAVFPSGAEFSLEVAADVPTRLRGYMFREFVGPHEGMLFVFEEHDRHGIWMKNCLVPLDIIWLDDSLRVVDIRADFPPCPPDEECASAVPESPARYVLEVAGGITRSEGLRKGDVIIVLPEVPRPERP